MRVVEHRDVDRFRDLARTEGDGAARRGVVRSCPSRAVHRCIVHCDLVGRRTAERDPETQHRTWRLLDLRIRDRQPGWALDPGADGGRELATVRRAGHARRGARGRGAERDRDRSVARWSDLDPVLVELGLVDAPARVCDSTGDGERVAHGLVLVERLGAVEDLFAEHEPEPELALAVMLGGHVRETGGEGSALCCRAGAGLCRHRDEQGGRQHPVVRRAQRPRCPALAVRREHDGDVTGPVGRDGDLPQIAPPVDPARARHGASAHLERAVAHVGVAVRRCRRSARGGR